LPFREKAFNIVLALDLVEHLKKEDSIKLISNMKKLAKRLVIITTPNGFTSGKVVNGNILQLHMCGYTIRELKQFGYKVRGIGVKVLGYFRHNILSSNPQPILEKRNYFYFPKNKLSEQFLLILVFILNNY
jgi:hypothetical protein